MRFMTSGMSLKSPGFASPNQRHQRATVRFENNEFVKWSKSVIDSGTAVTVEMHGNRNAAEGPIGTFVPAQTAVMGKLRDAVRGTKK